MLPHTHTRLTTSPLKNSAEIQGGGWSYPLTTGTEVETSDSRFRVPWIYPESAPDMQIYHSYVTGMVGSCWYHSGVYWPETLDVQAHLYFTHETSPLIQAPRPKAVKSTQWHIDQNLKITLGQQRSRAILFQFYSQPGNFVTNKFLEEIEIGLICISEMRSWAWTRNARFLSAFCLPVSQFYFIQMLFVSLWREVRNRKDLRPGWQKAFPKWSHGELGVFSLSLPQPPTHMHTHNPPHTHLSSWILRRSWKPYLYVSFQ